MKLLVILITLFSLLSLTSCNSDDPTIPTGPNSGVGGNDDLNPGPDPTPDPTPTPTPTPPPTEKVVIELQPSDLNKDDTTLVYRKMFKPVQLGEPRKHRHCDDDHKDTCVVNRQVLFQFSTTSLNETYEQELWDVTKVTLKANYYSIGKNHRTELLCLLNNRLCTGKAISKIAGLNIPFIKLLWRNQKFWIGRDEDHVMNDVFHQELLSGKVNDNLFIRKDLTFDIARTFILPATDLQTLVRKNEGIHFSVTDDTFVEDPVLTIHLKRRLPSRN